MKILKPILTSKIPPMTSGHGGRTHSPIYDTIVKRVKQLPQHEALPIKCESIDEYLQHALGLRGCSSVRRRTIVYVNEAHK